MLEGVCRSKLWIGEWDMVERIYESMMAFNGDGLGDLSWEENGVS